MNFEESISNMIVQCKDQDKLYFKFINILMLIKRRPSQFTGFVENKYRREHVMITNVYIVRLEIDQDPEDQ